MNKILISTDTVSITAELSPSGFTQKLIEALPVTSAVNTWGEEIYFDFPALEVPSVNLTKDVNVGDVAFWPEGNCLCVFFGRTPMSTSERPVPASAVLVAGKLTGNLDNLHSISDGDRITVQKA